MKRLGRAFNPMSTGTSGGAYVTGGSFNSIVNKLTAVAIWLTIVWVVILLPFAIADQNATYDPELSDEKKTKNREMTALVARNTALLACASLFLSFLGELTNPNP
jgi:preprotein translocase subunit SecG